MELIPPFLYYIGPAGYVHMLKAVFVQHIYISDIKNSAKIGTYVDYLVSSVILSLKWSRDTHDIAYYVTIWRQDST